MTVITVDVPQWREASSRTREAGRADVVGARTASGHPARARQSAAHPVRAHRESRAVRSPAVPTRSSLRITRRGRVVVVLVVACLVAVLLTLIGTQASADGPGVPAEVTQLSVSPGQTLWEIAAGVTAAGEDVRDTIAVIADLNGLDSSVLRAGDRLVVPIGS
ncbi:hypothetical protein GCM10025865_31650 [Paraoerskovia sediminicola]|uniref:LysM domain-containing protein n=1 Tax=Paraoerskovia sediminicola TaxID=1138587 RepID=A0ABM8G708_9CELL|nr:LysM peptidoglycan-binding domain-containing protein [Paraoerskovia sediminicola]BDZ43866.1 hypothetical protein GCM10025865_31650 [Paraoerskovia sediminicola]